jgi:hypothetical protein
VNEAWRGGAVRPPNWDLLASISLLALALLAYLAYPTAHYSYDAVASGVLLYQWIASGDAGPLFHRYHVLYLPFAAGAEIVLKRLGLEVDPLTLLQLLNAPFAAGAVALFYRVARALEIDVVPSMMLTILLGGGFGYWYFATNGESYPISIFFLLLAFLSAARQPDGASWARSCLPGVWLGLAAGFHGTCLLALPGLVVMTWPLGGDGAGRRRVAATLLATGLVLGAPYAVRYLLSRHTGAPTGPSADVAAFAHEEGWSMRPRMIDEWVSLSASMAPSDWPSVPPSHPALAGAVSLGLLVTTLLPLVLLLGVDRARRRRALAVAVWFAACFVFFSMYFATSPKFASYQWIPLLLLVGLALQQLAQRRSLRPARTVVLAMLVAASLFGSFDLVRRQTDPESNPHLARARAIARLTKPDDLVVHLGRGENQYQKVYLPYFAVRRSLVLERLFDPERATAAQSMQALEARLASAAAGPGRIVVLSDAVDPGSSSREFETTYGIEAGALARLFASHHPRLLAEDPAAGRIYVLTAPASPDQNQRDVPVAP